MVDYLHPPLDVQRSVDLWRDEEKKKSDIISNKLVLSSNKLVVN